MKALFHLTPAIEKGIIYTTLLSTAIWIYPNAALATTNLQVSGINSAQIFEIKNPADKTQLNFDELLKQDPLVLNLKAYLEGKSSPLAEYAPQIVQMPYWEKSLAVSWVESNMCIHSIDNNCSGIGVKPGHPSWRKYPTKLDWFKDMAELMQKPIYAERYTTFRKMKGVYVQPGSESWVKGAEQVYAQLTDLENQSDAERLVNYQKTQNIAAASEDQTIQLAQLNK